MERSRIMLVRRLVLLKRCYSAVLESKVHPLLNISGGTWRSREELVGTLLSNTVYETKQLIAFNKPIGLSVFGASRFVPASGDEQRDELQTLALRSVLPDLCKCRQTLTENRNDLDASWRIVVALEREFSGVTLIAKIDRAHRQLLNFYQHTIGSVPHQLGYDAVLANTFLVIVRDARIPDRVDPRRVVFERVSVNAQVAEHTSPINKRSAKATQGNYKPTRVLPLQPGDSVGSDVILTRTVDPKIVTKALMKRPGTIHRPFIAHHVLARNESIGCALVAVRISNTKWHALEAYLVSQYARILGESLYSRLVSYLNEQAVYVPLAAAFPRTSTGSISLDKPLRDALQFSSSVRMHQIPTFVHRYRLVVPRLGYTRTNADDNGAEIENTMRKYDILTADLPRHFVYALERLNLSFDPRKLESVNSLPSDCDATA